MSEQETGGGNGKFDPTRHLRQLRGRGGNADYLDVKWRLVWLRSEHPDAQIATEHVTITSDMAIFKAQVGIPGGGSATGYGSEASKDFTDFIEKAECVPLRSECLTRDGFKRFDELVVGEEVLAYDVNTDRFHWTPLRAVTVHEALPMVTLSNDQGFSVDCTPDHSWAIRRWTTRENRRCHVSELREAQRLTKMDRIILTAGVPAPGGDHPLTPVEAAILGWLMTDGTLKVRGIMRRIVLYQSKPAMIETIRQLVPEAHEVVTPARKRTFPTGRTYDCLPQSQFVLPAMHGAALLDKAGLTSLDMLPSLVAQLSQPARAAMLEAMMLAEADVRGNFAQRPGPVLTAFQMLAVLEGYSVGQPRNVVGTDVIVQRLKRRRTLSASQLTLTALGPRPAWCPTTDYGTWIMRQDGRVLVTGNTKALGRALIALGYGTPYAQEFGEDDVVESAPSVRAVPTPPEAPRPERPGAAPQAAVAPRPTVTPYSPRPEPIPADTRRAAPPRPLREAEEHAPEPLSAAPRREVPEPRREPTPPAPTPFDDEPVPVRPLPSRPAPMQATPRPAPRPAATIPAPAPNATPAPASSFTREPLEEEDEVIDLANYGWTEFWSWARARGFNDRKSLDAVVGRATNGMTPLEIRKQIQAKQ